MGADAVAVIDDRTWEGVNILLDDYAAVAPGDTVVVAYTPDSCACAAWVCVAVELRGIIARRVPMHPLRDAGFAERLRAVLADGPGNGRLVVLTFERDTMSHSGELRRALSAYDEERTVVIRAISAGADLFAEAVHAPPSELSARNAALLERFMPAEVLHIETESGTSLDARVDSARYHWISNRAVWRPGRFVILPAGEVATYPASVDGTLVANYAFNVNAIVERDALLGDHPVAVEIENGRVVGYDCADDGVLRFLESCFETPNARRVGELGFGTNLAVTTPVARNTHINERRRGVHLGFGQHNQPRVAVEYECELHLDLVARGGRVWVDCEPEPIDLERVPRSPRPHTVEFSDEDVFSPDDDDDVDGDCCGLLSSERANNSLPRIRTDGA